MRVNQPVTGRERSFGDDLQLISTTNLKGVITYANPGFVEVSGFSLDELQGQPHNMVRHPDMPEQAFADLWRHLKANKPWLGVVKNRCKNGDHYWVSAYVMPMFKNGEVVGYESVRTRPTRQVVERAARIYDAPRLRGGGADEVRKLASNTQNSTTRINEIVEGLRRGAAKAADSMTRGQARTREAVGRAAEAGEALTAIAESVARITDMNVQVASAVEEQAAVAEEINRNISNISQSTEARTRLAKSTTRQSEDLLRLVLEMEDMTSRFAA